MRVHDVTRFRAAGVLLDWPAIAEGWLAHRHLPDKEELLASLKGRLDVRLVWACSRDLGVPRTAFTVWTRPRADKQAVKRVPLTRAVTDGELVIWGGEEVAEVSLSIEVFDPWSPVAVFLLRAGTRVRTAVAVEAVHPGGAADVTLTVRTGAATHAVVVNGHATDVWFHPLRDVLNDDAWEQLEWVGLPVPDGGLREYAPDPQGMVSSPETPVDAAVSRLKRAGAPLGWQPVTESGLLAPPWSAPDPGGLVKETQKYLLPELPRLYSSGLSEYEQQDVADERAVDSPSREDGRRADQPAKATLRPLDLLLLAAGLDPWTNLATGFGTGYSAADLGDHGIGREYLITAPYKSSILGDGVEVAAYVPPPQRHRLVPPVVDLQAGRAALLPPAVTDERFRESIEVSWRAALRHPTLTDPVAHAFAGWFAGEGQAVDLLPERPLGGSQSRAIPGPTAPVTSGAMRPGADRPRAVHPAVELPLEGPVTRGYAVAQVDLFGLWSRWEDVLVTTAAPSVLPPRIASLTLEARHTGSALCPASVTLDFAVDWTQRSPGSVDVRAIAYPMPTGNTPPPPGIGPEGAVPAGCHQLAVTVGFLGDIATAAGATIAPLADDGALAPTWGAAGQGPEHRAYRLVITAPALDFGAVSRWGVQLWVREAATGLVTPSVWSPDPQHPATAQVASPVPAQPVPPPLPPGVPLGSTPDAEGLSHARISWSGLASPQVDRVVIWEASETTLRHHLSPALPIDRDELLGWRLQRLRDLYDAAPPDRRQLAFRRAAEVPAAAASADVALPRGSEDIHVFVVTAMNTTGLESPWPDAQGALPAHAHLQSVTAPRLRQPSLPVVRPLVQPDGTVRVGLESSSAIPVTRFEVFATRSEAAARDHLTMGPPVASVPASAAFAADGVTPRRDPITRHRVYTAEWSGALPPSWDPWWLRATAVPVDTVDPAAERGLVSVASDVATLSVLPTGAPHLDPLAAEVRGADHRELVIRTATTALDRPVPSGPHRIVVNVGTWTLGPVPLADLPLVADALTPPDTSAGPVVQRLPRIAGSTPLVVWALRDAPTTPVDARVRVIDPLGREAQELVGVPAWVDPVPELTLEFADVFSIAGRGVVANLVTTADAGVDPPYLVSVVASRATGLDPWPVGGRPPRPTPGWFRSPIAARFPSAGAGGALRGQWKLPDIPTRRSPVPPRGTGITPVRSATDDGRTAITLWIPVTDLTGLTVSVSHPDRGEVKRSWRPGS